MLRFYEQKQCLGIEVDFGKAGVYYDSKHGPNWWSYYCEPIVYGKRRHVRVAKGFFEWEAELNMGRQEAFGLIQRHIRFKPFIWEKIKKIEKAFEGKHVIGVHYRGTDKIKEAPRVSYEEVFSAIKNYIDSNPNDDYKIFIATDERNFINSMQEAFGDMICYNIDNIWSIDGRPIHLNSDNDQFKCGENAIVDSILLSRTHFLIKTSSNLSLWSTFFNPDLRVLELNKRY
ncbi:MAG: hypothetical protein JSS09_01260 [Verrucomicrobia bacterium]|nr:hypothetical protein [Verrucomicrobiota bacterium]